MIKIIQEVDVYGGKMYVREGLASDVADLQANYINAVGALSKNRKFHTGDSFTVINGGQEYEFEEGSNQWYLQA